MSRASLTDRPAARPAAAVTGVLVALVGALGFVPGITSHAGDLAFAGRGSGAKLLGSFQVSILHNTVHLLFGIAGLVSAKTATGARVFLTGGGLLALALWFVGASGAGGWIPLNAPDNWLHFLLGIGMLGLGSASRRDGGRVAAAT